jgi:hypothetical protein
MLFPIARPMPPKVNGRAIGNYFQNPTIFHSMLDLDAITQPSQYTNQLPTRVAPLLLDAYFRESPARLKQIIPRHNQLSERFVAWLKSSGYTDVTQEVGYVDVEFLDGHELCRAELKTCYGVTTTKAIREAMGQLLEYNLYGSRPPAKRWIVILDREPSAPDLAFIHQLAAFGLPIGIGWETKKGFQFAPATLSNVR